jgi:hypothetical protein
LIDDSFRPEPRQSLTGLSSFALVSQQEPSTAHVSLNGEVPPIMCILRYYFWMRGREVVRKIF